MEEQPTLLDSIVGTIRKPEARSEVSQAFLAGTKDYFTVVFDSENQTSLISQIRQRKGCIFPAGSVLRGTARIGSDLDMVFLYAEPLGVNNQLRETDIADLIERGKYHPTELPLRIWMARKFRDSTSLRHLYENRRMLLQQQIENSNRYRKQMHMSLRTFKEEDVEKQFMGVEFFMCNVEQLTYRTRQLSYLNRSELGNYKESAVSIPAFNFNGENQSYGGYISEIGMVVPQLLTLSSDQKVESVTGSIKYHQRGIVQALADLQEENAMLFEEVYTSLENNFVAAVLYDSPNHGHVGTLEELLRDYVMRSGRFSDEKVAHATDLLSGVKKQVSFPPFEELKDKYLGSK